MEQLSYCEGRLIFEKHKKKKLFFFLLFFLRWIPAANHSQLLTLDQVPEITDPIYFLWVGVINPAGQITDLESVSRLSWPQCDHDFIFVDECTAMHFDSLAESRIRDHVDHVSVSVCGLDDQHFKSVRFWKECDLQAHVCDKCT